jgi:hypothetical protein
MSKRTLFVLVIAGVLLAACLPVPAFNALRGSGNLVTRSYDFAGFDSVAISHAFQAEIVMADRFAVEVTVDDNLVEHLQVEQKGQRVMIGLAPNLSLSNATRRARITLPRLVSIEANGASHAVVSGFKTGDDLRIAASGASSVKGDATSGDLTATVTGASTLNLQGRGKRLNVNAAGASTADLRNFATTDAAIEASGASRVNVNVTGKLDARADGASHIRYTGQPTLGRMDQSGSSSISGQ